MVKAYRGKLSHGSDKGTFKGKGKGKKLLKKKSIINLKILPETYLKGGGHKIYHINILIEKN